MVVSEEECKPRQNVKELTKMAVYGHLELKLVFDVYDTLD